ncbi:c-type cytochrome [Fulvivirga lutea]|uniref:Cytochrome c n=1 Tax=Fulvivirga lutea TaxID=2810512 RepID=A0A974WHA4_9BACT|nr:cytochrome c [Fulvivirga lutea]QSE97112.1 cytochrome c [Fulvivirga lutea]
MRINTVFNYLFSLTLAATLVSCGADGDNQGLEYAPNMYHSVPYEPLSQITDEEAGEAAQFLNDTRDGHGEYYNSNPLNAHGMTMRTPAPNTVPRNKNGILPYRIPKDSLEIAAEIASPIDSTMAEAAIKDGKILYGRYCEHCHGAKGEADGLVAEKYPGVANLQGVAYKNITEGHIFHVITWGKGLMGAHGSQVSPEDRWKIAKFVKSIQK